MMDTLIAATKNTLRFSCDVAVISAAIRNEIAHRKLGKREVNVTPLSSLIRAVYMHEDVLQLLLLFFMVILGFSFFSQSIHTHTQHTPLSCIRSLTHNRSSATYVTVFHTDIFQTRRTIRIHAAVYHSTIVTMCCPSFLFFFLLLCITILILVLFLLLFPRIRFFD